MLEKVISLIILICAVCSTAACAQSFCPGSGINEIPGPETIPARTCQIFSNYSWSEYTGSLNSQSNGNVSIGAIYGVSDRITVGIVLPYSFVPGGNSTTRGLNDIDFGFQYYMTGIGDVKLGSSFGVRPATACNNGVVSNGTTDYSAELILGADVKKFNFRAYYGQNFWGDIPGIPRASSPYYGFAARYTPSRYFVIGTEIFGRQSPNVSYSPTATSADLWTRTFFGPSFSLDLGMSFGLNPQTPVRQYLVGLTYYSPDPAEKKKSVHRRPMPGHRP